jgi:hypothetical protein
VPSSRRREPAQQWFGTDDNRIVTTGVMRQDARYIRQCAAVFTPTSLNRTFDMHKITVVALTFTTALLSDTLANAADFSVEPLKDGESFIGCLAQNTQSGIGFLAVADKVALFANTARFPIEKGDEVKGSWAVDHGDEAEFSSTADSAHTATIDVPNTPEAVAALTSGKVLRVKATGVEGTFPLAGTEQAFTDLIACMQKEGAE